MEAEIDRHLNNLRQALQAQSDADRARSTQRYFPHPIQCLGVSNGDVMALADTYVRQHSELTPEGRLALCEALLANGRFHEEVMLGLALIRKVVKRSFDDALLVRFRYWLEHRVTNWAQCDDLCLKVIYAFFLGRPHLIEETAPWTQSPSPWCRRAANVALVKFMNRKIGKTVFRLPLERVFTNSTALLADPDPYVQKSVGWLLKAAAVYHGEGVVSYLQEHISQIERGTLRYAVEKLEPVQRKALLRM